MRPTQPIARPKRAKALRRFATCWVALGAIVLSAAAQSPVIVLQPQNQQACPGSDVTFYIEAIGAQPLNFYWYRDTTNVFAGALSTAANSSLTVTNVQLKDAFSVFNVVASNAFGHLQSRDVSMSFPDPAISRQPANSTTPLGGILHFEVAACGTSPLTYRWFKGVLGVALTNDARVTGANTPQLLIFNALPTDSDFYWAAVTNSFGGFATSQVARGFVGFPPTVGGLTSRVVRVYTSTTFQPAIGGTLPFSYQWYRNDVPLPGETNSTLTRTNVQRPEVGLYHVRVSNGGASVPSEKAHLQARLTLEGAAEIFREEATDFLDSLTNALLTFVPPATVVFHGVPLVFSTYDATAQPWETSRCGVPPSHSMWVRYTAPRAEPTKVSTEGSSFDTVLAVYSWDGNAAHSPVLVACDDNSGYDGLTSLLSFDAAAKQVYYIAVDGVGGATGTARLQVGELIRNVRFDPQAGTFQFELAGPYWHTTTLQNSVALSEPSWPTLFTRPASTNDWVAGYTNFNAFADAQRFYRVVVNTNSSPSNP
jgi:hypothetical protein